MQDTKIDALKRQLCPRDMKILTLIGAWEFNGRIHTDKFKFVCNECGAPYVGSAKEAEQHQDGLQVRDLQKEANKLLTKSYE